MQHIRAADRVIVHVAVIVCATSVFHTFYAVLVLTLAISSAVPTKTITFINLDF